MIETVSRSAIGVVATLFLATTAALPAISIPAGFDSHGMPVGLQLIGPPRGEAKLLAIAAIIEREVGTSGLPIDPRT